MFSKYLENLRYNGKRYFTSKEIREELKLSDNAARSCLYFCFA